MRRARRGRGCPIARPQLPQRAVRSRALPAPARLVQPQRRAGPLPERGHRLGRRAPGRPRRRPGDRRAPDGYQVALQATCRRQDLLRCHHPRRRLGRAHPRYRPSGRIRPAPRRPAQGRQLDQTGNPAMERSDNDQPIEVLTFDLQGETFALAAAHVREILDLGPVTTVPNSQPFVSALLNVRGKVVPLADLRLKFGMEQKPPTIDTRIVVIEVDLDGEPAIAAILADKVHEVTEVAAASLAQTPRIGMRWRPEYIRCIGKRDDDFIIVLDIARIFSSDEQKQPDSNLSLVPAYA